LINGNVGMLHQVFTNLFSNAIYAMGGGKGSISVVTAQNDNQVEITIQDTGSGMSKEVLKKNYRSFLHHQTSRRRYGFGIVDNLFHYSKTPRHYFL